MPDKSACLVLAICGMAVTQSRTQKTFKNIQVATLFYLLNLILQFFSRKVFLDYLGSEVLGLNTTAQNLLSLLNLAELGIGIAVAYNLYKPLYDHDWQTVNDIVSIQGWLYRKIALVVAGGAVILMFFFPLIFAKAEVPLWYTYGSFGVLLLGSLLGYFFNYKQIVLSADQKQYKITYSVQGAKIVKILMQILTIRFLSNGYIWWLSLEAVSAIVTSIVLQWQVRKEYPWLHSERHKGGELQKQYPGVVKKTKQVFFHQIGSYVLHQTTPMVIYGFTTLSMVAIYGNYMLIVTAVIALMDALLNGMGAGVGNLVAEGNKQQIKRVYWELTSVRIWLSLIFCTAFLLFGDVFVKLWVGEQYLLPRLPFILIVITAFVRMTRTNDVFLSAYGLFQDIWAPITEACLNLGLSIVLGYFYGLTGILCGVLMSLLLIVCMWKPYFLYSQGFREKISEYVIRRGKLLVLSFSICIISYFLTRKFINEVDTYAELILLSLLIMLCVSLASLVMFYITDKFYRSFIKRMYSYFINKINAVFK